MVEARAAIDDRARGVDCVSWVAQRYRARASSSAGPWAVLGVLALIMLLPACTTVREISALRNVSFSLAGVSGATLAGVSIQSVRGIEDLTAIQVASVAAALARGQLPVETNLLVQASNPPDNVQARLVELDWTLFLDGQQMVSGVLERDFVLPPGQPVTVPVRVRLDLLDVFDGQLEQMVNLALALAGTGDPRRVRLEARPSIQTPLGPIRYPARIPIEYEVAGL